MALLASLLSLTACGGGSPAPAAERGSRTARAANAAAGESAPAASPAPAGASATASRPADGRACEPRRLHALFIGTSLTAGYGLDDPSLAYPAVLQRMADSAGYDVEIVNAGVSGETSAGALRRTPWLLRTPADVVVLETGANDGLRAFDPDSTRANLRAILDRAHAALPRARLLLVQMEAPPNLGAS